MTTRNVRHKLKYKTKIFENTHKGRLEKEVKEYLINEVGLNKKETNNEFNRISDMIQQVEDEIDI